MWGHTQNLSSFGSLILHLAGEAQCAPPLSQMWSWDPLSIRVKQTYGKLNWASSQSNANLFHTPFKKTICVWLCECVIWEFSSNIYFFKFYFTHCSVTIRWIIKLNYWAGYLPPDCASQGDINICFIHLASLSLRFAQFFFCELLSQGCINFKKFLCLSWRGDPEVSRTPLNLGDFGPSYVSSKKAMCWHPFSQSIKIFLWNFYFL